MTSSGTSRGIFASTVTIISPFFRPTVLPFPAILNRVPGRVRVGIFRLKTLPSGVVTSTFVPRRKSRKGISTDFSILIDGFRTGASSISSKSNQPLWKPPLPPSQPKRSLKSKLALEDFLLREAHPKEENISSKPENPPLEPAPLPMPEKSAEPNVSYCLRF